MENTQQFTYRVSKVSVQNKRKVGDVSFHQLDENLNVISGMNGAGKSTMIDAIFFGVLGRKYYGLGRSIEDIIKEGEKKLEVQVTLESRDNKKITIKRHVTAKGNTDYLAVDDEMEKLTQTDLNALLRQTSIDPLSFTRLSKKEQYQEMKVILGIDTTEIDEKIETQFTKTQNTRAIYTEHKKTLDNTGKPEQIEHINTQELSQELAGIVAHNTSIKEKKDAIETGEKYVSDLEKQIKDLQEKLQKGNDRLTELKKGGDIGVEKDETVIRAKIERADENNQKAQEFTRYCDLTEKNTQYKDELSKDELILDELREEKKKMIRDANPPIKDMEFTENDGVKIKGIPLDQYSSGEQLMLATQIIASTNPLLKIIYIKDGSLLDDSKYSEIKEFAQKNDYQFFIEKVGEEVGTFVMREGELVGKPKEGALSDKKE